MADDSKRIWDKYERFQGLSNRWLEENPKMKRADLALALGIKPGSLKQYWGGYQIPGRALLDRMVKVFRVDYSDLRASQDGKLDRADSTYRDVIGNLIGAAYGGYRDRAKIGLDDVRAARALAQSK